MRIDFSSNLVRAALSVVFSPKTYSHLVSEVARRALALMVSIKNAALGRSDEEKSDSPKAIEGSSNQGESESSTFIEDTSNKKNGEGVISSEIIAAEAEQSTSREKKLQVSSKYREFKSRIISRARSAPQLTITAIQAVTDVLVLESPLNKGLKTLQSERELVEVNGDGNCCYYSMAFGIFHRLQTIQSMTKEQLADKILASANHECQKIEHSPYPPLQEIVKNSKTAESLKIVENNIRLFLEKNTDNNSLSPLDWVQSKNSRPLIRALRYLTALMGMQYAVMELSPESLEASIFQEFQARNDKNAEEYLKIMTRTWGGESEVMGFSNLFALPVDIYNLVGIGQAKNAGYTSNEAIERGRLSFRSPLSLDIDPIALAHYRVHYDAVLPRSNNMSDALVSASSQTDGTSTIGKPPVATVAN